MTDHYKTLGVSKNADPAAIKKAYRRKSRAAHPDRDGDHQAMVVVNRAYQTLSDPNKRARYDETGNDDNTPKAPLDVQARSVIMQVFMQVIEQAPDGMDVIQQIRLQVANQQQQMKGAAKELRAKAAKAEKRAKRIKRRDGQPNFLAELLEQQINAWKNQADQIDADSGVVGKRALEILEGFTYDPEQGSVMVGGVFWNFQG